MLGSQDGKGPLHVRRLAQSEACPISSGACTEPIIMPFPLLHMHTAGGTHLPLFLFLLEQMQQQLSLEVKAYATEKTFIRLTIKCTQDELRNFEISRRNSNLSQCLPNSPCVSSSATARGPATTTAMALHSSWSVAIRSLLPREIPRLSLFISLPLGIIRTP